ncbi:MAG: EsaB/YukD family protein [Thermoleophilaceae bacterium]|nr:EsaB/YukD family protein [Thermoleophilaceae bacterium]
MDVIIVDAAGSKSEEATLPGDVAIGRIVEKLVDLLNYPAVGPDGAPLLYRFHHKASGRQLDDDETLTDAEVSEGDTLRLVAEITAG